MSDAKDSRPGMLESAKVKDPGDDECERLICADLQAAARKLMWQLLPAPRRLVRPIEHDFEERKIWIDVDRVRHELRYKRDEDKNGPLLRVEETEYVLAGDPWAPLIALMGYLAAFAKALRIARVSLSAPELRKLRHVQYRGDAPLHGRVVSNDEYGVEFVYDA